jgi:LysM repeat protein
MALLIGPFNRTRDVPRRPGAGLPPAPPKVKTPPLQILGSRGSRLTVPFAPLPVDHGGLATTWVHLDRPLRDPYSTPGSPPLRTMSFELTLEQLSWRASIEPWIRALQQMGKSLELFVVAYGPTEAGLWHLENCSIRITRRVPGTNDASAATAALAFAAANDVARLGPMSGGSGGARATVGPKPVTAGAPRGTGSAVPPKGAAPVPAVPAVRTYTVKANDSLSRISQVAYGSTAHWRAIADFNKVPNPDLIRPGLVLKLPARP